MLFCFSSLGLKFKLRLKCWSFSSTKRGHFGGKSFDQIQLWNNFKVLQKDRIFLWSSPISIQNAFWASVFVADFQNQRAFKTNNCPQNCHKFKTENLIRLLYFRWSTIIFYFIFFPYISEAEYIFVGKKLNIKIEKTTKCNKKMFELPQFLLFLVSSAFFYLENTLSALFPWVLCMNWFCLLWELLLVESYRSGSLKNYTFVLTLTRRPFHLLLLYDLERKMNFVGGNFSVFVKADKIYFIVYSCGARDLK